MSLDMKLLTEDVQPQLYNNNKLYFKGIVSIYIPTNII